MAFRSPFEEDLVTSSVLQCHGYPRLKQAREPSFLYTKFMELLQRSIWRLRVLILKLRDIVLIGIFAMHQGSAGRLAKQALDDIGCPVVCSIFRSLIDTHRYCS